MPSPAPMQAFLLSDLANPGFYLANPWMLLPLAFQIWMLVDAIRREEWIWAIFIFIFSVFSAVFYYFMVYRSSQPLPTVGLQLPGSADRSRIKELQTQIHHLDKAHHHAQLGDIYFQQGKLADAEKSYRDALARDAEDPDIRSHLGHCLLRQGRPAEARDLLAKVCAENPAHDYGHSMMAYAETLAALGEKDAALAAWRKVLEKNTYARARVQLAELLIEKGDAAAARRELEETLADASHAPAFQQENEKIWMRRARKTLAALPG